MEQIITRVLGCLDSLDCRLLELSHTTHSDQLLPFIGWVVAVYGSVKVEGRSRAGRTYVRTYVVSS